MGKGMAYLVLVVLGALLLWYSGLLDEFRAGSNLQARETFWREQVRAAALDGGSRAAVERFAARHQLTLQCDAVPAGSDITATCQVIAREDLNMRIIVPMCAWNDGNTSALIGEIDPGISSGNARDVDLAGLAERTRRIRAELRQPIN
jgi:hypothetical protein